MNRAALTVPAPARRLRYPIGPSHRLFRPTQRRLERGECVQSSDVVGMKHVEEVHRVARQPAVNVPIRKQDRADIVAVSVQPLPPLAPFLRPVIAGDLLGLGVLGDALLHHAIDRRLLLADQVGQQGRALALASLIADDVAALAGSVGVFAALVGLELHWKAFTAVIATALVRRPVGTRGDVRRV